MYRTQNGRGQRKQSYQKLFIEVGTDLKKIHLHPSQLPAISPIALGQKQVDHSDHCHLPMWGEKR